MRQYRHTRNTLETPQPLGRRIRRPIIHNDHFANIRNPPDHRAHLLNHAQDRRAVIENRNDNRNLQIDLPSSLAPSWSMAQRARPLTVNAAGGIAQRFSDGS
jgi:hypothetical protein